MSAHSDCLPGEMSGNGKGLSLCKTGRRGWGAAGAEGLSHVTCLSSSLWVRNQLPPATLWVECALGAVLRVPVETTLLCGCAVCCPAQEFWLVQKPCVANSAMPNWDAFPSEWEMLGLDFIQSEYVVYGAAWTSHLSAMSCLGISKDSAGQEVSCQPSSCLNGMLTAELCGVAGKLYVPSQGANVMVYSNAKGIPPPSWMQ